MKQRKNEKTKQKRNNAATKKQRIFVDWTRLLSGKSPVLLHYGKTATCIRIYANNTLIVEELKYKLEMQPNHTDTSNIHIKHPVPLCGDSLAVLKFYTPSFDLVSTTLLSLKFFKKLCVLWKPRLGWLNFDNYKLERI